MFKERKLKKAKKLLKKRMGLMLEKGIEKEEIIKKAEKVGWSKEVLEVLFDEIMMSKKNEIELTIPLKKKKLPSEQEEINESDEGKPKKGLLGRIKDLNEKMDIISETKKAEKKYKKKSVKLPFKVKSKLKKLAVKNKAMVLVLQGTKNIEPVLGERKAGMLLVGDMIADGAVDSVWLWRGKYPTYLLPEWDLKPINKEGIDSMRKPLGAGELYKDALENKRLAYPQQIILRAMEAKESLMFKAKANVKGIILTVIVTIIVAAVLFGGGIV